MRDEGGGENEEGMKDEGGMLNRDGAGISWFPGFRLHPCRGRVRKAWTKPSMCPSIIPAMS